MAMIPNKYRNGKIYKLTNTVDDRIYIGSTIKSLTHRLGNHRRVSPSRNSKLYEHCNRIGWGNVSITLIENYPCELKADLHKREREVILEMKPMLNTIMIKTDEELHETYRQGYLRYGREHKVENKARYAKWYQNRTDEEKKADNAQSMAYVKANPEQRKATCKKYYQNKPTIVCGCGGHAKDPHRHGRTKQHIAWLQVTEEKKVQAL